MQGGYGFAPLSPISFFFMQVLAIFCQIIGFAPTPLGLAHPPPSHLGNSGTVTDFLTAHQLFQLIQESSLYTKCFVYYFPEIVSKYSLQFFDTIAFHICYPTKYVYIVFLKITV